MISCSVVISARDDADFTVFNCIDQTMFGSYPSGPEAAHVVLERLGFAESFEWLSLDRFDQQIDAFETGLIVLLKP